MSENPETIRANIEETRRNLGYDVDAVADKVTPSHIAHRQGERIRGRMTDLKERVMGTGEDTVESTRGAVSGAGEAIGEAPHRVARQTRGNPLAAGLIAFGAGMLVSSLIPPSQKEQEAAQALKEKAEPLTHELSDAASEAASHLKQPAQEAMESVKQTASDAATNVKYEAQDQGAQVQDRAQEAQQNIRES